MSANTADMDRRRVDRHRRGMAQAGWWGLGTMGVALPYALLSDGPHRAALIAAAAFGVLMSVALGLAATHLRLGRRSRRPVMLTYSAAHIVVVAVLAIADGGADSPMALGFFGTFTFVAYTMPTRPLLLFGALNVIAYVTVYLVAGADRPEYVPVALAGLLATASACAVQHRGLVLQRHKLAAMARTDPLTACLNRRGFEARLGESLARARRQGAGLALLLIDLDDFKAVNDVHGHAAGDELLVGTVALMRNVVGSSRPIGRLGGDEFAIVLAPTTAPGAEAIAASLRAHLDRHAPASVGLSVLGADGDTAEDLLLAADRRLYDEKAAARRPRAA